MFKDVKEIVAGKESSEGNSKENSEGKTYNNRFHINNHVNLKKEESRKEYNRRKEMLKENQRGSLKEKR